MTTNNLPATQDEGRGLAVPQPAGEAFSSETIRALYGCLALSQNAAPEVMARKMSAVNDMIAAFGARDTIEHAFAAQATALHVAGMAAIRQSTHPDMPPETASQLRRDAARLFAGVTDMAAAIERRRGKSAHQVVRVEHVTVEAGAQAVIGAVTPRAA